MARTYSKSTQSYMRYGQKIRDALWAKLPEASLAEKMYGQDNKLLSDSQRGCVSKLGGVARPSSEVKR